METRPVPTPSSLYDVSPFQTPELAFETPLKCCQLTSSAAGAAMTTGGISCPFEVPPTHVEPILLSAFLTQRSPPLNILTKSPPFPCTLREFTSPIREAPAPLPKGVLSTADCSLITLTGDILPTRFLYNPILKMRSVPFPSLSFRHLAWTPSG